MLYLFIYLQFIKINLVYQQHLFVCLVSWLVACFFKTGFFLCVVVTILELDL